MNNKMKTHNTSKMNETNETNLLIKFDGWNEWNKWKQFFAIKLNKISLLNLLIRKKSILRLFYPLLADLANLYNFPQKSDFTSWYYIIIQNTVLNAQNNSRTRILPDRELLCIVLFDLTVTTYEQKLKTRF